jgi:hypothetical protein
LYQQQDSIDIIQTCQFHNFVKPGLNLVVNQENKKFNIDQYINWFRAHGADFLNIHGEEMLLKFTGHPVIGHVVNKHDLETVVLAPLLEFEYLKF